MNDRPENCTDEMLEFLSVLQESGTTNMYGAGSYLIQEFPTLSNREAREIVLYWMDWVEENADGKEANDTQN